MFPLLVYFWMDVHVSLFDFMCITKASRCLVMLALFPFVVSIFTLAPVSPSWYDGFSYFSCCSVCECCVS